ncbi:MAG TPA: hypothetical protein VHS32_03335 [Streptosporangiaceae bacterium]|jgi:hypothetical protein|nr:hypothetical protein [Streptosporangiaceae bacterium]
MFVSDQAMLDVSFEVALARLAALTGSGALTQVSADAYATGASPGTPRLARSCFRDLITRPGRAVLAVRWETSGHDGEPFPVLDADLTLIPAGPRAALLQLVGVYRAEPARTATAPPRGPSAAFWTGSPRRSPRRMPPPARTARDRGPGRAGCLALARGIRGPRQ